jgi:hypothetical protein
MAATASSLSAELEASRAEDCRSAPRATGVGTRRTAKGSANPPQRRTR